MDNSHDPLDLAAHLAKTYLKDVSKDVTSRPVRADLSGDELRARLGGPMPVAGEPAAGVLERLAEAARRGTVATQGPRYFGFVVGGSLPVATAADWLVSAWDQNCGIYVLSPLVSVVEDVAASWLLEIAGLPASWSTGFVTGCQMANFTGVAAARQHLLAQAGWDVNAQGLFGAPPIQVFVSDESHYTIFGALRMLGLGTERLRRIPTDEQGRMRAPELARALASTAGPCLVCAQAGNVNTGAFDPIAEIAEAAHERGAWLHVDGAFGLWAAASPARRPLVAGVERADSIAADAHKWLNVPYDSGLAIVVDPAPHRAAMGLRASYLQRGDDEERVGMDWVPESSRRSRVLPLYALLRALGANGVRDLVRRTCGLARRMASRLGEAAGVHVLNAVVLNQVLVQFDGVAGADADETTRTVIARVQANGTCWAGGALWQGRQAMRISVSNWSTTQADIDRSADAIVASYRSVTADASLGR
jgi:glutamate/tyrosine decarboxylase-like PLP-dependent enzyme